MERNLTPVEKFLYNVSKLPRKREIIDIDGNKRTIYYQSPRWEDSLFQERKMRNGRLLRALDNKYDDIHDSTTNDKLVYASLLCSWNEINEIDLI